MKAFIIVAIALVSCQPAGAEVTSTARSAPPPQAKARMDPQVERQIWARQNRLATTLQPKAKAKLDLVVRSVLARLASNPDDPGLSEFALREVHRQFAGISKSQAELLRFYVFADMTRAMEKKETLRTKLDSMSEMSEQSSLRLQMMMDRRSKFMSMLSNMLKKMADSQESIIQNIK